MLQEFGPSGEHLFRGFKISAQNAGRRTVRNRLAAELARDSGLAELLMEWSETPWKPWQRFLAALDQAYLLERWRRLARTIAGREIVVAMALDPRLPVQHRGRRALRLAEFWTTDRNPEQAKGIAPVLGFPAEFYGDERFAAPRSAESDPEVDILRRRGKQLAEEHARLQRRLETQRAKNHELESESRETVKNFQQQLQALRGQLQEVCATRDRLAASIDRTVEERVAQFRREALGLTPEVQALRRGLAQDDDKDLLAQVQQALAKHRELNEKYSMLSEIREQVARLQRAEQELRECIDECVVVMPEIEKVRASVQSRTEQLQQLLPAPEVQTDSERLGSLLLSRIKSAPFADDKLAALRHIEEQLDQPLVQELLGVRALTKLRRAAAEQRGILGRLEGDRALAETVADLEPTEAAAPAEIWDIEAALAKREGSCKIRLFIDGYNAIRRIADLARIEQQSGLAAAREHFCDLCRRQAGRFAAVEVVFDGVGTLSKRESIRGLNIVFTANAEASQNADTYIAERMVQAPPNGERRWLVTDDFGLRERVCEHCAGFIAPTHFHRFVTAVERSAQQ